MTVAADADKEAQLLRRQVMIEKQIVAGLPRPERDRLDRAMTALEFFRGDFSRHPVRTPDSSYEPCRYERHSLIMQRVVNVLCQNLYAEGPRRTLPDHPQAQAWLEDVYRHNEVDALLQEADRLSTIGQVCAIQAEPGEDPDCPVELCLWDASSFVAWTDPTNQRKPIAVATIDLVDNQRRMRLWTALEVVTFVTKKLEDGQTAGGTAYEFQSRVENPYGILPFAFVHHNFPALEFWSGGPGDNFTDCNDYINFHLTEGGDTLRYNGKPIIKLHNVAEGWRPPAPIRPGDVWDIPSGDDDAGDGGSEGDADYLQADLGFVDASWQDLQAFIDHTLEMSGVPPGTIRLKLEAQSGVAIVYEQVPLILWAKGRQRPFGRYEGDLAKVVLIVGAMHLGGQEYAEYRATSAQLTAAAMRPGLVLRWPSMWPAIPGPEQDTADANELEMGITSRIEIIRKRKQLSREEAIDYLKQIAEDRALEQKLLGPTEPAPPPAPGEVPAAKPGEEPKEPQTNTIDDDDDESEDDDGEES